ncbi:MAG: winged helix-turn-helix transcriptional regulator [Mycobacteriaceae bacterium]|nr:winged helix-turn-helix transcriptional regulator [Mycobacteriaceae bacterium]
MSAILAAVEEFGSSSQVQVGRRCGIDQSDMHATVAELVKQGCAERAPDPADRRHNLITLTDAGRLRLDELDVAVSAVQGEVFTTLSTADRDSLAALLIRVLDRRTSDVAGGERFNRPGAGPRYRGPGDVDIGMSAPTFQVRMSQSGASSTTKEP